MKVKTKKAINIILVIALIIIVILLLLLLFGGRSFSKFRKTINSSGVAEIAKPIFVVDGTENIKIDGIQDTVYSFSVKNYDGSEISDVALKYNIEVINNSQAELQFELSKDGEKVELTNNKTEVMFLNGISQDKDDYELRIIYNNNPAIVDDISGNVQIKVEAIQNEVI